jgi:RNA polymerase sigma-70 factor (ECF subfamily)
MVAARVVGEILKSIGDPVTEALVAETVGTVEAHPPDLADHLASLAQRDATLLRRVFLLGETQEEAGRALGLEPAAARKRYQRALAKLRSQQKIPPVLSHSGSPVGL